MTTDPQIPDRLQADLRRVYRASVSVPGEVDAAMLAAAAGSTGIAKPRPVARMPFKWRVVKWGSVAAAVILAFTIPTQLSRNSQISPGGGVGGGAGPVAMHSGDVNGDGLIDILDAFALARALRDGDPSITRAEIDAAAAAAVRLNLGGGA